MLATPNFDDFDDIRVICGISKCLERFIVGTLEFCIMFILRVGIDIVVDIALISIV